MTALSRGRAAVIPWTEDQIKQLTEMWNGGETISHITQVMGFDRKTIQRRADRLGLPPRDAKTVYRGKSLESTWDEKLFEPWAERKARLARERAAKS